MIGRPLLSRDKYRAELDGGPMDGWAYDLPLATDPVTWQPVPYERIGLEEEGEYQRAERRGDRWVYRWIGRP